MNEFRPGQSTRAQAVQLMQTLRDLARQGQQMNRRHLSGSDLSPSQWHCLEELWREGAIPMGDLAERLAITRSSATRLVDPLEKRGLVRRKTSKEDRRSQSVDLTSRGEQLVSELVGQAEEAYVNLYRGLDAPNRLPLLAAVHELREAQRRHLRVSDPSDGAR